MKKIIYILLLFLFYNITYSQVLKNDHLVVYGETDTGRLFIKTVKGNIAVIGDENRNITNGDVTPFSNILSVSIDDKIYLVNENSNFTKKMTLIDNQLITQITLPNNIVLTQTAKFLSNTINGKPDIVLVTFEIKNNDTKAHNVRIRYVMDIDIEKFDNKFAYQTTEGKIIRNEYDFKGNVPAQINVLDNPDAPVFKYYIKLKTVFGIKPYRMIIAAYNKFKSSKFEFKTKKGASFAAGSVKLDSAVGVYFNFGRIIPSQVENAAISIGILNKLKIEKTFYTASLNVAKSQKLPPLKVSVDFKNTGQKTIKILKAILTIPDYMRYEQRINYIKTATKIAPGKSITFSWTLIYPKTKYVRTQINCLLKIYDDNMVLQKKRLIKYVFLTAGKKIQNANQNLVTTQLAKILNNIVISQQTIKLLDRELHEINFLVATLNTSTDINAYIAGQRTVSDRIFITVKKKMEGLLLFMKKREKILAKLSRLFASTD